jgi:hypothetical protein
VFEEVAFPAAGFEVGCFAVPARVAGVLRLAWADDFAAGSFFTGAVALGRLAALVVCGTALRVGNSERLSSTIRERLKTI